MSGLFSVFLQQGAQMPYFIEEKSSWAFVCAPESRCALVSSAALHADQNAYNGRLRSVQRSRNLSRT